MEADKAPHNPEDAGYMVANMGEATEVGHFSAPADEDPEDDFFVKPTAAALKEAKADEKAVNKLESPPLFADSTKFAMYSVGICAFFAILLFLFVGAPVVVTGAVKDSEVSIIRMTLPSVSNETEVELGVTYEMSSSAMLVGNVDEISHLQVANAQGQVIGYFRLPKFQVGKGTVTHSFTDKFKILNVQLWSQFVDQLVCQDRAYWHIDAVTKVSPVVMPISNDVEMDKKIPVSGFSGAVGEGCGSAALSSGVNTMDITCADPSVPVLSITLPLENPSQIAIPLGILKFTAHYNGYAFATLRTVADFILSPGVSSVQLSGSINPSNPSAPEMIGFYSKLFDGSSMQFYVTSEVEGTRGSPGGEKPTWMISMMRALNYTFLGDFSGSTSRTGNHKVCLIPVAGEIGLAVLTNSEIKLELQKIAQDKTSQGGQTLYNNLGAKLSFNTTVQQSTAFVDNTPGFLEDMTNITISYWSQPVGALASFKGFEIAESSGSSTTTVQQVDIPFLLYDTASFNNLLDALVCNDEVAIRLSGMVGNATVGAVPDIPYSGPFDVPATITGFGGNLGWHPGCPEVPRTSTEQVSMHRTDGQADDISIVARMTQQSNIALDIDQMQFGVFYDASNGNRYRTANVTAGTHVSDTIIPESAVLQRPYIAFSGPWDPMWPDSPMMVELYNKMLDGSAAYRLLVSSESSGSGPVDWVDHLAGSLEIRQNFARGPGTNEDLVKLESMIERKTSVAERCFTEADITITDIVLQRSNVPDQVLFSYNLTTNSTYPYPCDVDVAGNTMDLFFLGSALGTFTFDPLTIPIGVSTVSLQGSIDYDSSTASAVSEFFELGLACMDWVTVTATTSDSSVDAAGVTVTNEGPVTVTLRFKGMGSNTLKQGCSQGNGQQLAPDAGTLAIVSLEQPNAGYDMIAIQMILTNPSDVSLDLSLAQFNVTFGDSLVASVTGRDNGRSLLSAGQSSVIQLMGPLQDPSVNPGFFKKLYSGQPLSLSFVSVDGVGVFNPATGMFQPDAALTNSWARDLFSGMEMTIAANVYPASNPGFTDNNIFMTNNDQMRGLGSAIFSSSSVSPSLTLEETSNGWNMNIGFTVIFDHPIHLELSDKSFTWDTTESLNLAWYVSSTGEFRDFLPLSPSALATGSTSSFSNANTLQVNQNTLLSADNFKSFLQDCVSTPSCNLAVQGKVSVTLAGTTLSGVEFRAPIAVLGLGGITGAPEASALEITDESFYSLPARFSPSNLSNTLGPEFGVPGQDPVTDATKELSFLFSFRTATSGSSRIVLKLSTPEFMWSTLEGGPFGYTSHSSVFTTGTTTLSKDWLVYSTTNVPGNENDESLFLSRIFSHTSYAVDLIQGSMVPLTKATSIYISGVTPRSLAARSNVIGYDMLMNLKSQPIDIHRESSMVPMVTSLQTEIGCDVHGFFHACAVMRTRLTNPSGSLASALINNLVVTLKNMSLPIYEYVPMTMTASATYNFVGDYVYNGQDISLPKSPSVPSFIDTPALEVHHGTSLFRSDAFASSGGRALLGSPESATDGYMCLKIHDFEGCIKYSGVAIACPTGEVPSNPSAVSSWSSGSCVDPNAPPVA